MLLLIKYTLLYGIVLMLVALGGMFSEHSGIINIALEGIMVIGGVAGVLTLTMLPASLPSWLIVVIAVVVAALAGVIYSLLLAFASINLKADQTIGGLAYIVPPVQTWNFEVGVAGAGFLAMAVMIFGQWKPFNICGAAMFFAVFKSLANIADSTFLAQFHWSSNIYNMMPFIASMIILAFTSKNSMAPKAEGIPYDKGSR